MLYMKTVISALYFIKMVAKVIMVSFCVFTLQ